MVIFFEWHRGTTMDQKSRSGLPVTGEETGLGALASPLAGYLGKVQERTASLDYCPWCTSKGLTYALRSYRINLQESVTLCTNPQCLFPLVSRSLEDVLASLDPVEPTVGNKRKNASALEKEELFKPTHKRLRSSELESLSPPSITDTLTTQADLGAVNAVSNSQHAAPKTDGEKVNGYHRDSPVTETTGWDSPQNEDNVLDKEPENAACKDGLVPPGHLQCSSDAFLTTGRDEAALSPHCGALGISEVEGDLRQMKSPTEALNKRCSQSFFPNEDIHTTEINTSSPQHNEQKARAGQKSLAADITTCKDTGGTKSETEDLSSTTLTQSEELVPAPNQLFWSNSNNLCWLDSLLVALVNCKSLRKCKPKDEPKRSCVWQLMRGYEEICAAIQVHQQPGRDGVVRVPNHVLRKANADLQSLRMSVFKQLQPKLHCKLGQRETPVFALPLLLMMDSWVEPLFQSTFHWEFKCSECKASMKERLVKTLPTLTKILPDWRPLHAVHAAPCNVCRKRNQRRTMTLESVPPVFGLHFVEGLPDNDVRIYTFTFKGKRYSVTTIIQYNQQLKHFVTWIRNPDGSWLEYDDLKHPDCKTHVELLVPAQEIHVVFWEVEEDKEPRACSPSTTFAESPPSKNEMIPSPGDKGLMADELLTCTPDHSLLTSHNDTDIVRALSEDSSIIDTTVTASGDMSIGSTTLLEAFEGLNHNDIITLTLVELKADSDVHHVNDDGQTQDLNVPGKDEVLDSTPDSSSNLIGSEMSRGPDVALPTASSSSEPGDGSSGDPTLTPGARRRQGRGRVTGTDKAVGRQVGKKAAPSKAAPHISPPASSDPAKVINNKPVSAATAVAQENAPPVETTQQTSPVSSTDISPLSTSQKSQYQNTQWSFLLSRHPLHQIHKSTEKLAPTPVTQAKPAHSTPNPVRTHQIPGRVFSKPHLKSENESLPPKSSEMYGAFSVKSSSNARPQPVTSIHPKSLMNTTVVSGTSLPVCGAKGLPDISSSKKHSSHSSKVPPGLSKTEALRYKLIKKLKAKKKKLAKLNEMLGHQGGPDSTDLCSPNTVTSSTYDGSICDDLLSDLLSPATTASNLSPDSTGFLEMLATGQDGVEPLDCGLGAAGAASQADACVNEPNTENFLDDFFLQAAAQRPTEMETEALSALEYFV